MLGNLTPVTMPQKASTRSWEARPLAASMTVIPGCVCALVVLVVALLLFEEILPQAVCSCHTLSVCATLLGMVMSIAIVTVPMDVRLVSCLAVIHRAPQAVARHVGARSGRLGHRSEALTVVLHALRRGAAARFDRRLGRFFLGAGEVILRNQIAAPCAVRVVHVSEDLATFVGDNWKRHNGRRISRVGGCRRALVKNMVGGARTELVAAANTLMRRVNFLLSAKNVWGGDKPLRLGLRRRRQAVSERISQGGRVVPPLHRWGAGCY